MHLSSFQIPLRLAPSSRSSVRVSRIGPAKRTLDNFSSNSWMGSPPANHGALRYFMPVQGRIRGRMPIVLPMSATEMSHLGNFGLNFYPLRWHQGMPRPEVESIPFTFKGV